MEKKKTINVLTVFFFISHKIDIKTFLKWILNQCRTTLVNITHVSNNMFQCVKKYSCVFGMCVFYFLKADKKEGPTSERGKSVMCCLIKSEPHDFQNIYKSTIKQRYLKTENE